MLRSNIHKCFYNMLGEFGNSSSPYTMNLFQGAQACTVPTLPKIFQSTSKLQFYRCLLMKTLILEYRVCYKKATYFNKRLLTHPAQLAEVNSIYLVKELIH